MKFIRVSKPVIGKEELTEVRDSLESGWLTTGPKVAKFEEELAKYLGVKNVISTSSCTAAFHLLLVALGIGPGDEVITPSLTYTSLGNVLINIGAKPVFVDVDRQTLTVNAAEIEKKITNKTKAVVPVDYAGLPSPIDVIKKITKGTGISVIQDAATSFGATYKGKKVGSVSDFTCFSFYATKNMTTGEGGALATNNDKIAKKVRLLSKLGVDSSSWKRHKSRTSWFFKVVEPGLKYYMTDLQAAIGLPQLEKVDNFIARRKEIAEVYYQELDNINVIRSPYSEFPKDHVWNFYPILVNESVDRNLFMEEMEKLGVASSVYYIPMHTHPIFKKLLPRNFTLPITEAIFSKICTLPLYPGLTNKEVEKVIRVVRQLDKKLL